jgi:copper chaperone CopZ
MRVSGVYDAEVDLKGGTATVTFDPARTTPDAIAAAITRSGFQAKPAR